MYEVILLCATIDMSILDGIMYLVAGIFGTGGLAYGAGKRGGKSLKTQADWDDEKRAIEGERTQIAERTAVTLRPQMRRIEAKLDSLLLEGGGETATLTRSIRDLVTVLEKSSE